MIVTFLAVEVAKYTSLNDCFVFFFFCMSTFGDKSECKCRFTSLNTRLTFVKLLQVLNKLS